MVERTQLALFMGFPPGTDYKSLESSDRSQDSDFLSLVEQAGSKADCTTGLLKSTETLSYCLVGKASKQQEDLENRLPHGFKNAPDGALRSRFDPQPNNPAKKDAPNPSRSSRSI